MPTDMNAIERACKAARDKRLVLKIRAEALQDAIAAAHKRKLPGIRTAVAEAAQADAELLALLQEVPDLFRRPKSQVFHGLKVGYKAGSGKVTIADEERTVQLIEKHFPDSADVLIKTTKKPVKDALKALPVADLQKVGVTAEGSGEVVFLIDATDAVDKLVKGLLKGAEAELEEAEAQA